jgi:hypothetical protein
MCLEVTLETCSDGSVDILDPNHAEVGDATVGILFLRERNQPIDTFEHHP